MTATRCKNWFFSMSLLVAGGAAAATVVDIPFWGQANPPTNRTASATAPRVVPAGTDFRVKTVRTSKSVPFSSAKPGVAIIVR